MAAHGPEVEGAPGPSQREFRPGVRLSRRDEKGTPMRSSSAVPGSAGILHSMKPFLLVLWLAATIPPAASFAAGGGGGAGGSGGGGATPGGGGGSAGQGAGIPLPADLIRGCKTDSQHRWKPEDNLELSRLYNHGDWKKVQAKLETFIQALRCKDSTVPGETFRDRFPEGAPFSVVFLNEALETPVLSRVLVQRN